jgi:hypothetical protein
MSGVLTLDLEAALEARADADEDDKDAEDFWHRYKVMKEYLEREYYPWIQAKCPFFTDHGERHIQSVIQAASLLMNKPLNSESKDLSSLDLFLILSAILWHDVGNVLGRSGHATRVAEITTEIKKLGFPSPDIHRLVVEISQAHSGENGLKTLRSEDDCSTSHRTYTVYTRALAAIVRFADEISENQSRISHALLASVPPEQRIFWEYANCISASRPDPGRQRVIITVTIQYDKATAKFICPEFLDRVNETRQISLIEYVLCRLEKMNNERAYCASEFSRYTSISEIEARLRILRDTCRIEKYDIEVTFGESGLKHSSHPDIKIFDEFFHLYSDWKPERLEEELFR